MIDNNTAMALYARLDDLEKELEKAKLQLKERDDEMRRMYDINLQRSGEVSRLRSGER